MKLTIYNGSPRRKKSNSKILTDQFIQGYTKTMDQNSYELHYLAETNKNSEHIEAFQNAENILIIFPLYTDSMPGIVKYFFESLHKIPNENNKKIGFIVQSGFPEVKHSTYVERYLKRFTEKLGADYLGTVIKGGVEGIQARPAWASRKLFHAFYNLGVYFGENNAFNNEIKNNLGKMHQLGRFRINMFRFISALGIADYYWNKQLKDNNAKNKCYDQPYWN